MYAYFTKRNNLTIKMLKESYVMVNLLENNQNISNKMLNLSRLQSTKKYII